MLVRDGGLVEVYQSAPWWQNNSARTYIVYVYDGEGDECWYEMEDW